ncbi:MAG: hypothetical protein D3908_05575 [Candidatus Electrothrix sp. AUS4]|nr:hypothetical protein [Candidatus Electrothrix sp. AUS4]
MILFCEECGQRNSITLTPSLIENNNFTCQFCGFHSPFPFLDQDRKSTGSNPGITWEPKILRLGPETEHTEQQFQLIFKVNDIQTPELTLEPFQDYAQLIQVKKLLLTVLQWLCRPWAQRASSSPDLTELDSFTVKNN